MSTPQNISCEFFPPRTENGVLKLRETREQLQALKPTYFSVTFGAGGSTQEKTFETVVEIQQTGYDAAPHLSCIGSTKTNVRQLLQDYQAHNIHRIVALRGDKPSGWAAGPIGELSYANELVEFIRTETGKYFHIEVGAYPEFHPEAKNAKADLDFFIQKVNAGADSAITQYFYNADAYFRFVDNCAQRSVTIPIIPGIMPISNYEQLVRFSDTCGAEIPRWLRWHLRDLKDDKIALQAFSLDVMTKLCERLLTGGAPGLHFYTLNQAHLTSEIAKRLGII